MPICARNLYEAGGGTENARVMKQTSEAGALFGNTI